MKRLALVFPVILVLCLVATSLSDVSAERSGPTLQNAFVPDCPPPFASASLKPVDETCGNDGDASEAAHAVQNRAKNSFCAKGATGSTATDPILTTVTTFDTLQEKVEENGISFGTSANLPEDRNTLKDIATNADGVSIGEWSYVVFVGFMLDAHTAGKESVSSERHRRIHRHSHLLSKS